MPVLDAEKAARFFAGDAEILADIQEHYQGRIYRLGLRLFGTVEAARDFAQDVLVHAFERHARFDATRPFEQWFWTVAINLGRERLRRRREWALGEIGPEPSVPAEAEDRLVTDEQGILVRRALQTLKPIYRESLALRFESDLSLKEMARVMGISEGTVKSRLSRGLRAFEQAYTAVGGE